LLIHRRAAPMPRVSETVSEKELRVPKAASVRMVDSMRSGEMPDTTAAISGFGSPGAAAQVSGTARSTAQAMGVIFMARSISASRGHTLSDSSHNPPPGLRQPRAAWRQESRIAVGVEVLMLFEDRLDAACQLAHALDRYRGMDPLVLAIPRGAVPMGRIVADKLDGDLDVVLVRKLGSPFNPEFAIGAIDESGAFALSSDSDLATVSRDSLE